MAIDLNMDGHHISYLRAPEQNHHAATKRYADTKLSLLGGDMQGGIGKIYLSHSKNRQISISLCSLYHYV